MVVGFLVSLLRRQSVLPRSADSSYSSNSHRARALWLRAYAPAGASQTEQFRLKCFSPSRSVGINAATTAPALKPLKINGAGEGNRTLVSGLGSPHSTIEPHPLRCSSVVATLRESSTMFFEDTTDWSPLYPYEEGGGMTRALSGVCCYTGVVRGN